MEQPLWKIITPSQYEWEREALEFLRVNLPDHEPYRAWSNFEFMTADGAVYEIDLLTLTRQGLWLVEIKSRPGLLQGDVATWSWKHDGRTLTDDNPVLLANRKAKALAAVLKSQSATRGIRLPFLEAVVFLSATDLKCELHGTALNRVLLRDLPATETQPERPGIMAALLNRQGPGISPEARGHIDASVARAISRAIEQAGIRPSLKSRRIGDYQLADLLGEGPGFQDRLARHSSFDNVFCRVRQYTVSQADSDEERQRRRRVAKREFQILQTLHHPGILQVTDYREHDQGPALLFRYPDPQAVRLDHYLASHGHRLPSDRRLRMLREIADAIRYAHRQRVIHRALSPQSILVLRDEGGRPRPEAELAASNELIAEDVTDFRDPAKLYTQVFNWQLGVRQTSNMSGLMTHVEDQVECHSLVYMAPEALSDARHVSEASDVFSLGALAFHLFANRPPAGSAAELIRILRDNKGLSLSSVVDGVGPRLEEFIHWCTHPDVHTRVGSVEDFLRLLDGVEDEFSAPEESFVSDPLEARRGDRLEGGYTVEKELGQGATARALLVAREEQQFVLKVALTAEDNQRLHEEAEALRRLQSEFIVAIFDELEMAGRTVLVLQKAGEETLASLLRRDGVPGLELLGRYGEDLLNAVGSLERHGVPHRDIKPDNIGIRSLTKQRNQLILFDFSLTAAPLDNIRVGTAGYIDPFLPARKRVSWDSAADRYSATIVLFEMSAGLALLPTWGDGKSDPSLTDAELQLDAEKFDPAVRLGLVEFFRKALHRDPEKRFDNADEMKWAWQKVFRDAEDRRVQTASGTAVKLGLALHEVELRTPIAALGLGSRATNALERASILTARELLLTPIMQLHMMRGVGNQTRREITEFVARLRQRFPDINEDSPPRKLESEDDETHIPSLETLKQRVFGSRNPRKEAEWGIRAALLAPAVSTPAADTPAARVTVWPSQTDVAAALAATPVAVNKVLSVDRKRWAKDASLNLLRTELADELLRLGGIMTVAEVTEFVLLRRPARDSLDPGQQQQFATAVARALVETESGLAEPRFQLRRPRSSAVIACTRELAVYAETLGAVADRLAQADPLLPPMRIFQELFGVVAPVLPEGCQPLNNERLLRLSAAMSTAAAVSARQELYPRGMPAERALRLGLGALTGLGLGDNEPGFSIAQLRGRVETRYPEAERLPDRPELDRLLEQAGLDVRWNAETETWHRRELHPLFTSGSSIPRRRSTATAPRQLEITPDIAAARQFEQRLQSAWQEGGFLVLTVRPSRMRACEASLLKRFPLQRVSFDDVFLTALRREAKELDVDWRVVQRADACAPGSQDWQNLLQLSSLAQRSVEQTLLQTSAHQLLVHPGLIARYDMMSLLESLRDRVGHDADCPGIWVLVAADEQSDMPVLDGVTIPLISPSQRTRMSEPWIDNLHRGEG